LFTSYNTGATTRRRGPDCRKPGFGFKNALNDIAVADNITAQNPDMVSKLIPSNYTGFWCSISIQTRGRQQQGGPEKRDSAPGFQPAAG
jgi:hypothetical protein